MIKHLTLTGPALAGTLAGVLVGALTGLVALTGPAQAADECRGRMFINSIWPAGTDEDGYDYIVQIRNNTDKPLSADIVLGDFGEKITIPAITIPSKPVAPWQTYQTRIGTGKDPNINPGTVRFLYDQPASPPPGTGGPAGKPYVSLQNCHGE